MYRDYSTTFQLINKMYKEQIISAQEWPVNRWRRQ